VLGLPDECTEHGTRVGAGQEIGDPAQVGTQVEAQIAVVGRGQMLRHVIDEGIRQDVHLGWPPAVDGLLGDSGPCGDALDRHPGETALDQQVVGGFQDGLPGLFAASVPVSVMRGPANDRITVGRPVDGRHRGVAGRVPGVASHGLPSATALQRADALQAFYLPISARGGDLLYALVRASRPTTVVEFGTSFGISTLYLAAAVADNGTGRIFSTELNQAKVTAARANLDEAGLDDRVTILAGDALDTLADIPAPIGLVLLDGWKDLCLPVLRLLEPRLASGALVVADDINLPAMADYLNYVRDRTNGYVSIAFPVEDGMEISCRASDATQTADQP
jgi:predicted O-methyltransferase YrrM